MYKIKPMSKRAKQICIPQLKNDNPLPDRIDDTFPFKKLKVGESFFIPFSESTEYERLLAKERMHRYNKKYAVYFFMLKHKFPKMLEIGRLI